MRTTLVNLALIVETALLVWTAYVFYRWLVANEGPATAFSDLIPYHGIFAVVVVPWLAASAIIPACLVIIAIADRLRQHSNSN